MSRRSYSEINLHFVWHVKASLPSVSAEIEPRLYKYIRSYALQSPGLIFHEIGGTETHVHIAVTIPPTLLISDWIGKLKRREFSSRQSQTRKSEVVGSANWLRRR